MEKAHEDEITYDNTGVKLMQVRFYECNLTTDPDGLADNYCRWGDGAPINSTKGTVIPS